MENFNKQKWEDLNLSRDEVNSIGQALKKEEFRSLLADYVKEINDPDNRKQYEDEITQLENERGVDVKFIHPTSGYVIKTSVDGKTKAFVNICTNSNVGVPFITSDVEGGQRPRWSIPYCLVPPRDDFDKKKKLCVVYDVVFHPDALALSKNNFQFKKLINDTALEGIEDNFKVSLDKINLKFPKMQFKGLKHATVIRKKIENFQPTEHSELPNYPYPSLEEDVENVSENPKLNMKSPSKSPNNKESTFTTPKYTIKHQSTVDMENFTNDPMSKMAATVPNALVISIDLPLLKCSSDASVDVTEKTLTLVSEKPAKYKLELKLPYFVDRNRGSAKFDMSKKVLTVTVPVIKEDKDRYITLNKDLSREDSGVESDNGNGRSNSLSSNEEEEPENITRMNKIQVLSKVETLNNKDNLTTQTEKFLNPNLHYSLPNHSCKHLAGGNFMVILEVPNVNVTSLKHRFLNKSSGFHINFESLGAGFFPINYAVYLMIPPPNKIVNDSFSFEVIDSNLVIQVKLIGTSDVKPIEYYIGTDHDNSERKVLPNMFDEIEDKIKGEEIIEIETEEINAGVKNLHISESTSSSEDISASPQQCKSRTVSESQQGEVKRSKYRGILKIGRSLSESSVDDYASWSAGKNEKTKKTVRFSDVISKQVFRMNSSILGQRKKNQRKTRNKKRAQERRLSESGNESEGDVDFSALNHHNSEIWLNDAESSSCDVSEVSDVSDISESDDGQKENGPPVLPCSNRKNHKRRGKKSARKSAATAKFNYSEY